MDPPTPIRPESPARPAGPARPPHLARLLGALLAAFALLSLPVPPSGGPAGLVPVGGTLALGASLWLALGGPGATGPGRRAGYALLALALVAGLGARLGWDPRGLLDLSPLVPVLPLLALGAAPPAPRGLRVGAGLLALAVAGHPAPCAVLDLLPIGPAVERGALLVVAALLALHGLHALGAGSAETAPAAGSAPPGARRASPWSRAGAGGLLALALWGGAELARGPGLGPEPDDEQVAWERPLPARADCGPALAARVVRGTLAPALPVDGARLVLTRGRDGRRLARALAVEDGAFHGTLPPARLTPGAWDARLELLDGGEYLGYREAGRLAVGGSRLGLALAGLLVAASCLGRHAGRASLVVLVLVALATAVAGA